MKQGLIPALGLCLTASASWAPGSERGSVRWIFRPTACHGGDKGCRPPTSSRTQSSWDDLLPSMRPTPLLTLPYTNSPLFRVVLVQREFGQSDREACFFLTFFSSPGQSHPSLLCSPPRVVSCTFRAEHYPAPIGEGV